MAHRIADFVPQSVVNAPQYGMQIATYAPTRFVEPPTPERRALVVLTTASALNRRERIAEGVCCVLAAMALILCAYSIGLFLLGR